MADPQRSSAALRDSPRLPPVHPEWPPQPPQPPQPAALHPDAGQGLSLERILDEHMLGAVFLPVLDLRNRSFHGYESLVRGPAGSGLERPDALFAAARAAGRLRELDQQCARAGIAAFARLGLQGRLFLNVTEALFDSGWFASASTLEWLHSLSLNPSRLVLELLESDELQRDGDAVSQAGFLRELGYGLALDDLGQGFGRFSLWHQLRPRYLKIDRDYITNIGSDPFKAAFVRSVLLLAEASASMVIAEGVESERDLLTLRELGVPMAQGYLIGRPQTEPPLVPQDPARRVLATVEPGLHVLASRGSIEQTVLGLARLVDPVHPETRLESVLHALERDHRLTSVPVVDSDGNAQGIINRYVVADRMFRPHVRDLFGNKPCRLVMSSDVLRLDYRASLQQASDLLADASYRHATEGVLVTEDGKYRGILLVGDLLRMMTEFQVQAARYANPLTLLPGNVPINDCIDRWLREDRRFAAAYCDIDHFKPFNDRFGYRMGDEIILALGERLKARFDGSRSFVGHVGGDDFVVLTREPDWERSLSALLEDFSALARSHFEPRAITEGGYWAESRRGEPVFFALPTLSIGAFVVNPQAFDSHREIAARLAELKKVAKRSAGNILFVERRQPGS